MAPVNKNIRQLPFVSPSVCVRKRRRRATEGGGRVDGVPRQDPLRRRGGCLMQSLAAAEEGPSISPLPPLVTPRFRHPRRSPSSLSLPPDSNDAGEAVEWPPHPTLIQRGGGKKKKISIERGEGRTVSAECWERGSGTALVKREKMERSERERGRDGSHYGTDV